MFFERNIFFQNWRLEIGDSGFGKMRKVWKLVHDISGRNVAYAGKIDGSTEEERVEAWKSHFKGLLGQRAEEPTQEEFSVPYR